jgi:subtilase family serine protease
MRTTSAGAILAVAALTGCAVPPDDSDEDAGDAGGVTDPVSDVPNMRACGGGRFACFALVQTQGNSIKADASTPSGLGPADLQSAYNIKVSLNTHATIAIVDAFDYPAAESDLATYRAQFGLPPCTTANGCFKRVNQNGAASPLPGKQPPGDDWNLEAALDLDMASAACPSCKIVLVEAQDDQGTGLYIGNDGAATAGAVVVSNSWGGSEDGTEGSFETHFTHSGVTHFASTGDSGFNPTPQYPSTSAHVVAVGGTTLSKSTNTRGWAEKAWADGGSSCSGSIPKPSFQPASSACSKRMASDVAAVGDPNTGVAVFNKADGGWIVVGGTSASSPLVAGMYALYGISGVDFAYANETDFRDVKTGRNGSCTNVLCKAGTGWDGPTGVGTPNGRRL